MMNVFLLPESSGINGSNPDQYKDDPNIQAACVQGFEVEENKPDGENMCRLRVNSPATKNVSKQSSPDVGKQLCVIQDPSQPTICHLLPSCGCWWEEGVGVCLEQVSELQRNLREKTSQWSSVLHQEDLAAQQVKSADTPRVKGQVLMCQTELYRK